MRGLKCFVVLALILTLLNSIRSDRRPLKLDARVHCVFKKSCVLPCSFHRVVAHKPSFQIYWDRISTEPSPVYSYSFHIPSVPLHSTDTVNRYDDRANLFLSQLSKGNASLLLSPIKIQDQGTYRCLVKYGQKVIKRSFVHVDVQAPVSDVILEEDGQRLNCVSKDIFPKPTVSWSPPSDHSLSVTASESGLFSVLSSVPLTQGSPLKYSCNVSNGHSWRSATYRRRAPKGTSDSEVTLLCTDFNSSLANHSRVWKFNHNETILTQSRDRTVPSEAWRPFVVGVSEFGSLTLKGLRREHKGLYSCELTSDRETQSIDTRLKENVLRGTVWSLNPPDSSGLGAGVCAAVAVAVVVTVAAGLTVVLCVCKHKKVKTCGSTADSGSDKRPNTAPPENGELLGGKPQVGDGS